MIHELSDFTKYGIEQSIIDRIIFVARIGSYNYGLQTETSDQDYKIYILPSLEELISEKRYNKVIIIPGKIDMHISDIRNLADYVSKSHPSALEIMYSSYTIGRDFNFIENLNTLRDEIAHRNPKTLYHTVKNTIEDSGRRIQKQLKEFPNEYDKKLLVTFMRHRFILENIANGFSFGTSIRYDNLRNNCVELTAQRDFLKKIRTENMPEGIVIGIIQATYLKLSELESSFPINNNNSIIQLRELIKNKILQEYSK